MENTRVLLTGFTERADIGNKVSSGVRYDGVFQQRTVHSREVCDDYIKLFSEIQLGQSVRYAYSVADRNGGSWIQEE